MSGREWRIDLPGWKPLSANGARGDYRARARAVKAWRHAAALLARSAGIPQLDRVQLELHYVPRHQRRRDPMNLVPTLKAVEDGVVDAGVIRDDTPDQSIPTVPVIDPPSGAATAALYLIVRHVPLNPTTAQEGASA